MAATHSAASTTMTLTLLTSHRRSSPASFRRFGAACFDGIAQTPHLYPKPQTVVI